MHEEAREVTKVGTEERETGGRGKKEKGQGSRGEKNFRRRKNVVTKERRQGKAGSKWKEEALTFQKVTWACRARLWGPSFQLTPCPAVPP